MRKNICPVPKDRNLRLRGMTKGQASNAKYTVIADGINTFCKKQSRPKRDVLLKIAKFFGFKIEFENGNNCRIFANGYRYDVPVENCEVKMYKLAAVSETGGFDEPKKGYTVRYGNSV